MGICPARCQTNMSILENASESVMPAHEDSVTVSLCTYPAFDHVAPTMCIGERLTILSDDGDFMIVRSATTGLDSYIPTSYTATVTNTWMFTGISRYKAIELLMLPHNRNGAFLIRESETNSDCYSLSILMRSRLPYLDSVKHYRISRLQNGCVYISPRLTFRSLQHLVEHYSESADGLCCRLTAPCCINSLARQAKLVPTTARRPTINWKNISRSMIFKRKRTESDNSFVSEGLREAISSYLQITEGSNSDWET